MSFQLSTSSSFKFANCSIVNIPLAVSLLEIGSRESMKELTSGYFVLPVDFAELSISSLILPLDNGVFFKASFSIFLAEICFFKVSSFCFWIYMSIY